MMGAGTRYQRAAGIDDGWEALFHDYMTLNQWQVEAAVVQRLVQRAGAAVEWLGDLGVEYYDQLVFGGDETKPRVHCPIGRGQAVVDVLARHCRDRGVDFALGRRIDRLVTECGAVTGVAVGDDVITDGIIITGENYDTSSDPEWKYVNVRRTLNPTVDNEDKLTLEAVIEEAEAKPHDAYFVRNDRSTVSQ
jgi:succinate dehydrogenase/fumarate reductase flavoprotein subunit